MCGSHRQSQDFTLKIASAQVVETSLANNSPFQDSNHPDDHFQSRYVTPGFKLFATHSLGIVHNERVLPISSSFTARKWKDFIHCQRPRGACSLW